VLSDEEQLPPVQHRVQTAPRPDGRNTRRDRNRVAVVDAYLDLIADGNPRPSVAEVATRSGVSHRSVFRYFADRDELTRTSIERQVGRVVSLLDTSIPEKASLSDRIDLALKRRFDLFEAIGPVARLVRALAPEQELIRAELANNRLLYRTQVQRMFAPELNAMDATRAADTIAVLDVLLSFESYDLMSEDQNLERDDASRALKSALIRLFS
jgi:TetR/AcrR family transcriptional regulator, regulator of autoinduction and epiphytic fitness